MLSHQPLVAFVGASEPSRAKAFYEGTLGLRLVEENPYILMFDAGGTQLIVSIVPKVVLAGYTVLGWVVDDIRSKIADMSHAGIAIERYPGMPQDEFGVWTEPASGAQVAWFQDPDGNTLSISQLPPRS
jgi:catechol 2,3-dioxygenase-like lactoylglutathione lyase family enzyme